MEDPTTLAINLTYLGTLGLAVLMFLGLGLVIIITLVVAGVGRLISVILLALIGIFPKKDNTPIVHLPAQPGYAPDPAFDEDGDVEPEAAPVAVPAGVAAAAVAEPAGVAAAPVAEPAGVAAAPVAEPAAPAVVKDGALKTKANPRKLPKPAEVKSAVEHQTAHHPIVVAATKEPPVLAKDWADAVAEADRREAERAKAQQPPPIRVTVRDLDEPAPSSNGQKPAPAANGANTGSPASPAKKQNPGASAKGKPQVPAQKNPGQKDSLSGVSRNS
ncbi:hypothetical protein [Paenarthrobacter sp. JL.01a]|uniref:hypothetical protein n=1 Tax=Paenarthrobacter sp. JL.01a TaxID=2979324 RepID=UPI0021C96BAF|nr:hypothetical protein [Paenarthrobacter sp. JL.01a]UXM91354.1 hypothetical protein N5P29_18990 [Paenarthrobacter sp. JL.01a]